MKTKHPLKVISFLIVSLFVIDKVNSQVVYNEKFGSKEENDYPVSLSVGKNESILLSFFSDSLSNGQRAISSFTLNTDNTILWSGKYKILNNGVLKLPGNIISTPT